MKCRNVNGVITNWPFIRISDLGPLVQVALGTSLRGSRGK